jgi:hypothetical protein
MIASHRERDSDLYLMEKTCVPRKPEGTSGRRLTMSERTQQIEALEAELRDRGASVHVGDDFDEKMREAA